MFEYTLEFPRDEEGNLTNEMVVKTECICNGKRVKEATLSEDEVKKGVYIKALNSLHICRTRITNDGYLEEIQLPKAMAILPHAVVRSCTDTVVRVFKLSVSWFKPVPSRSETKIYY